MVILSLRARSGLGLGRNPSNSLKKTRSWFPSANALLLQQSSRYDDACQLICVSGHRVLAGFRV